MMTAVDTAAQPDVADRNQLVLDFYPLVRTIACRIVRRLPSSQDVDELINVGVLGLMDALDRFEPERGVPLKAYAEIRIRGAIMDALRAADWTPRSVRRKANQIEAARTKIMGEKGREPSRQELARALEMSPSDLDDLRTEATIPKLVSMNRPNGTDTPVTLDEQVPSLDPDMEDIWVAREIRQEVVDAIKHLPKKERTAITLYYLNGLTLKEIGEVLGVTESRACQLRAQGVKRLKTRLSRSDG